MHPNSRLFFLPFIFLLLQHRAFTQNLDQQIDDLYRKEQFKALTDLAVLHPKSLADSSLLRAGTAALIQKQDSLAGVFYATCTNRFPDNAFAWYTRSLFALEMQDAVQSRSAIEKALSLEPKNPDFWLQKGAIFDALDLPDSSLLVYQAVTFFDHYPPEAKVLIGDAYFTLKKYQFALDAYLDALKVLNVKSRDYQRCLFNTASAYYMLSEYAKSEKILERIIDSNPEQYRAVEKLIQDYYGHKKYKEAEPLKQILYKAHQEGKLPESMRNDFCFDQFDWRDERVYAYERFEEKGLLYYKHVFYVVGANGRTTQTVQTEHSAAIASAGKKYVLGMDKGKRHYTYISYLYGPQPDYNDLRIGVLDVLEGRAKASSSSSMEKD